MGQNSLIYKICPEQEWEEACVSGVYAGSADDKRDGYIHFSTRLQLAETLAKHFAGQDGLLLLAVDVALLDPVELKFEISRKGEKFPHLYGKLFPSAVKERYKIHLNDAGKHEVAILGR